MAKRALQEINAGSMADIAFLLLIFFLVATTMDIDTGIGRTLPPYEDVPDDNQPPIKERNLFIVLVNKNDNLMVEGEPCSLSDLRNKAKEFIANPYDKANLPEKTEQEIPYFGKYLVSKQIISLQNDFGTSYGVYLKVMNELTAAYNELRNELSMETFGKKYDDLDANNPEDEIRLQAIKDIYPNRISEAEPKKIGVK